MQLQEMSGQYRASAQAIALRITELKRRERQENNEEKKVQLRRRIADLKPLQIQCRELEQLTAHYHDRRYRRNGKYVI